MYKLLELKLLSTSLIEFRRREKSKYQTENL